MKKSNFLAYMFLIFVTSMIAIPNFSKNDIHHNIKEGNSLPISLPWTIKQDKLSLVNCINYAPDTSSTVYVKFKGIKDDTASESLTIDKNSQKTFFINELKSFSKITSKNGIIELKSDSPNTHCYVNYYNYNNNDNINGIYSLTSNDIFSGKTYFVNNKSLFNKKIKSLNLHIINLSNSIFSAEIKSYSRNGSLKKTYSLESLKEYNEKILKLKAKSNLTYHIVPTNASLKYIAYLEFEFDDAIEYVKPLTTFNNSLLLPLTSKISVANVSDEETNLIATIYSNSKVYLTREISISPYATKSVNLKRDLRDLKEPTFKLTSKNNNVIALTKHKDQIVSLLPNEKVTSNDVILGYNLSLGEKGNLEITNNNDKTIKVDIYINLDNDLKIIIKPFSTTSIKLNKFLNKKSLIGYIYISSNEKISAKLNSVYEKRLTYTKQGSALNDINFEASDPSDNNDINIGNDINVIEKPEYIIK